MMFGTILTSGMQMIANCGFTQRNITIVAMALSIGIGFTLPVKAVSGLNSHQLFSLYSLQT